VAGVVITHGTDTLEETAWVLHRLVDAHRPVVMTAAMRPATSLQADGPPNLLDAVTVARRPGARGVVVALGGQVLAGAEVRKVRSWGLDAFASVRGGPVALVQAGAVVPLRPWPEGGGSGAAPDLPGDDAGWPWVEVLTSHAGAGPRSVQALVAAGVQGLVVAATGNGTVHHQLEDALRWAMGCGVAVRRATRCAFDGIVDGGGSSLPSADDLTPAQARADLMLELLPRQR
jgi:L-asparaginase